MEETKTEYQAIEAIMKGVLSRSFKSKNPKRWGDVGFYTPEQWKDRGEKYGLGSLFVMTFEGPVYSALNYGVGDRNLNRNMRQALEDAGYYYEFGYAWSMAIYRIKSEVADDTLPGEKDAFSDAINHVQKAIEGLDKVIGHNTYSERLGVLQQDLYDHLRDIAAKNHDKGGP